MSANELLKKLQAGNKPAPVSGLKLALPAQKPAVTAAAPVAAKPAAPAPSQPIVKQQTVVTMEPADAAAQTIALPGEIPATAPVEGDAHAAAFAETLMGLKEYFSEPAALSGILRSIMLELKAKPHYIEMVSDDHIHTMVKAMRETLGMVQAVKATNKAKGGGAKKERPVSMRNQDIAAIASEVEF